VSSPGRPAPADDDGLDLVPARNLVDRSIDVWFPLSPGDQLLVGQGDAVATGTALAVRLRDRSIHEVRAPRAPADDGPQPGAPVGPHPAERWSLGGSNSRRPEVERAGEYLVEVGGRWRIVTGEPGDSVESPLDGTVVEAVPGAGIRVRARARALRGVSMLGEPVRGRLQVATQADGELRAPAIDVGRAGQVLVVGARIDAEALTRARAMGVRGIVVGGLPNKERRDFLASETRQRAARQGLPPFAVLVLEGSVRRPIASPVMAILEALEGGEVAIVADPPALIFDDPLSGLEPPPPDLVRVRGGPLLGQEGRWMGLAGVHRFEGGLVLEAGLVDLDGEQPVAVPIGDLERFA
jgi:hypothetical protein